MKLVAIALVLGLIATPVHAAEFGFGIVLPPPPVYVEPGQIPPPGYYTCYDFYGRPYFCPTNNYYFWLRDHPEWRDVDRYRRVPHGDWYHGHFRDGY